MNMQKCFGVFLGILILLVPGCAPQPTPSLPPAQTPTEPPTLAATKAAWQQEWDRTLATAKGEGKLVVYSTGGAEVKGALGQAFKDKFGIDVEWVVGRGVELFEKLSTERRAGLYLGDVYLGGSTQPATLMKPAGMLAPIKPLFLLPEVLDTKAFFDDPATPEIYTKANCGSGLLCREKHNHNRARRRWRR